jgi:radical SAM superfamily enzyme YgiQ (UPF0313 family)
LKRKRIHTVGVWLQDIHHGRPESLTKILDENHFDIVGLGFVAGYYQYRVAKEISHAVNQSKRRKEFRYVLGGHGPAAAPGWFMGKMGADTVVVGDGERAICNLAENGKTGIIQGLPYESDEFTPEVIEDLFPAMIYRLIRWPTSTRTDFCWPVLSSRGCKWHCSFCYRMRKGFYERSVESIMEEVKWLHNNLGITHIQFSDELLMGSQKRTEEICESILQLPFKMKWDCNGRLNYASNSTLQLMKKSGCEYVNYGIESLSQSMLDGMQKGLSVAQIHAGVQRTLAIGLSPGLNLLWGFPNDNEDNLWLAVEFLKKYDTCDELRTIRPVTPYPGTPLFELAVKDGLVKDVEDFYERAHVNSDLISVNFMDMPTELAHEYLFRANKKLVENYLQKRGARQVDAAARMYLKGDTSFRGFRSV